MNLSVVARPQGGGKLDIPTGPRAHAQGACVASPTITVVIPTLNEAESIGQTIDAIPRAPHIHVMIVDGASRDGTQDIARGRGAEVVVEPRKGYGRAYKTGFEAAKGDIIVTMDGDLTYPAERVQELADLLLSRDLEFITCDRLTQLKPGVMSRQHRLGNWALAKAMNILFGLHIRDSQSGMWVFRREAWKRLTVVSDGMPFSEELKVEAWKRGLRCAEVPIDYRPRVGEVKLNTWRDGWRNLKFLLKKRFGNPGPTD